MPDRAEAEQSDVWIGYGLDTNEFIYQLFTQEM